MNRKILITGANGFIGKYVTKIFLQAGFTVYAAGRNKPDLIDHAQFIHIDLLETINFDALFLGKNFTHLVHLAWCTEHGKFWHSPLNFAWKSVTIRLLESFCSHGGKSAIITGTCAEYGINNYMCNEYETPCLPSSIYGEVKNQTRIEAERLCAKHGVRFVWARIFFPYGHGEDKQKLISSLIRVFQGKQEPFAVNLNSIIDFIHVNDVSSGLLMLLISSEEGIFNICNSKAFQIREVVKIIASHTNFSDGLISKLSCTAPENTSVILGDNTRLKKIGWESQHDINNLMIDMQR